MESILIICDCDGVLTPMNTFYNSRGRLYKVFSSHDSYAIKNLLKKGAEFYIVTADKKGFPITQKRADDWKITAIHSENKLETVRMLKAMKDYKKVVFVGNGPEDITTIEEVDLFYAPKDSRPEIKSMADKNEKIQMLPIKGGEGILDYVFRGLYG